jgi:uncharacterized protein (DUF2141 family)
MTRVSSFCVLFALLALPGNAPTASLAQDIAQAGECLGARTETKLTIEVEGVRSAEGVIRFTVYSDDPERFLVRRGPISGLSHMPAPAVMPTVETCVWLPGPGAYALSIFHDANESGNIDTGMFGIPTEGFGFSNDPPLRPRKPYLEEVLFEVPAGEHAITISLHYVI